MKVQAKNGIVRLYRTVPTKGVVISVDERDGCLSYVTMTLIQAKRLAAQLLKLAEKK